MRYENAAWFSYGHFFQTIVGHPKTFADSPSHPISNGELGASSDRRNAIIPKHPLTRRL